jgi:transcriptional regulator with XRE-family HTH domain
MDFTKLTKEARERQKPPTGYQLAKALGVTPGAVYRWEEGGRKPTGDNLLKLLRLAGKLAITAIGFFVAFGVAPIEKTYASETLTAAQKPSVLHIMRINGVTNPRRQKQLRRPLAVSA